MSNVDYMMNFLGKAIEDNYKQPFKVDYTKLKKQATSFLNERCPDIKIEPNDNKELITLLVPVKYIV